MDKTAYEKANDRYRKAERHLAEIAASQTYEQFKSAWTDFLLAWNTGYTVLEQGAKATPQCKQWFGSTVKKDRRSDPLIQYMHQARNADEHGVKPISDIKPGSVGVKSTTGALYIKRGVIGNGRIEIEVDEKYGKPIFEITPATAILVTVHDDRFKQSFDPPTHHNGEPIADTSPLSVATLALSHLNDVLIRAKSFIQA